MQKADTGPRTPAPNGARRNAFHGLAAIAALLCFLALFGIIHVNHERNRAQAELQVDHYLGATVAPLDRPTALAIGAPLDERGVIITSLSRGGPGQRAGLAPNDVIDAVALVPVGSPIQLAHELKAAKSPTVDLWVRRHGVEQKMRVWLGRSGRPTPSTGVQSLPRSP